MRIRFGPFILNLDTRQLTEDNRQIHLTPKAFDLLTMLVQDRPKVLSKAALQNRLWPDTFVAEANLSNLIAEIREALRDQAHRPDLYSNGARLWLRVFRRGHHLSGHGAPRWSDRRARLEGIGCAFHSRWASTSLDAIPT